MLLKRHLNALGNLADTKGATDLRAIAAFCALPFRANFITEVLLVDAGAAYALRLQFINVFRIQHALRGIQHFLRAFSEGRNHRRTRSIHAEVRAGLATAVIAPQRAGCDGGQSAHRHSQMITFEGLRIALT